MLSVQEIGSFFVGGEPVALEGLPARTVTLVPGSPPVSVDPNGTFWSGQMYVHYVRLVERRAPYPLLLWHGGAMTGAVWESTPDGRPGWQSLFLRCGHDVYVADAVERGRAGWSRFPEIFPGEPFFRSAREAWTLFRMGPDHGYAPAFADRCPFVEQRFPHAALDELAKSFVPRWNGTEQRALSAYLEMLDRLGPSVVVAHSQGGAFAWDAALARPDLVRGLVLVEPGGAPDPCRLDVAQLAHIPILCVWGDNLGEVPFWRRAAARVRNACAVIDESGGDITWLDLPAEGVRGNSHLLMMDDNSDAIAARIQAWLASRRLAAPVSDAPAA